MCLLPLGYNPPISTNIASNPSHFNSSASKHSRSMNPTDFATIGQPYAQNYFNNRCESSFAVTHPNSLPVIWSNQLTSFKPNQRQNDSNSEEQLESHQNSIDTSVELPFQPPLASYSPESSSAIAFNVPQSFNDSPLKCVLPPAEVLSITSSSNSSSGFTPETLTLISHSNSGSPYISGSGKEPTQAKKKRIRIRKDKEKHNLSEVRRRAELRERFVKLQNAVGCEQKDRASIISNAAQKIQEQEELIKELQNFKLSVLSQSDVKCEPKLNELNSFQLKHEESSTNLPLPLMASLISDYPNSTNEYRTPLTPSLKQFYSAYSPSASPLLASYPTVCIASTGMLLDGNLAFLSLFQLSHPSFHAIPTHLQYGNGSMSLGYFPPAAKALHSNTLYTITHPQFVSKAHGSLQLILNAVQQSTPLHLIRWKQTCITSTGALIDVEITLSPVYCNNRFRFCTAFLHPIEQSNMNQFTSPSSNYTHRSIPSSTPSPSSSTRTSEIYYDY